MSRSTALFSTPLRRFNVRRVNLGKRAMLFLSLI